MATVKRMHDPSWGDVVVKEADDPAGRARLAREATVLDRARHPGVVELISHHDDGDRAVLVTRSAGERTAAELVDLPGDQVAAFGAALAQTLADLHRAGVSHGTVRPEHVVVSDQGQPVLCGLADAGLVEPPEGQSGGFDPAGDAGAVADVLAAILEPAEGLRRWSGGVPGLLRRAEERSMDQLAAELAGMAQPLRPPLRPAPAAAAAVGPVAGSASTQPTIDLTTEPAGRVAPAALADDGPAVDRSAAERPEADEPAQAVGVASDQVDWLDEGHLDDHPFWSDPARPSSDALSLGDPATVEGLFAPARTFGPRPPRSAPETGRRGRVGRLAAVGGLALLAVLAGATTVAALTGSDSSGTTAAPDDPAIEQAEPSPSSPAAPDAATAPLPPPPAVADCPTSHDEAAAVGVPAACADRISAAGNQISLGLLRWVVGSDGDLAVAGDFDCDGWLEVASMNPQGAVAVFDGWAGGGQEPTGRILQQIGGARALVATARGACHDLVVERVDQPPATVPMGAGS